MFTQKEDFMMTNETIIAELENDYAANVAKNHSMTEGELTNQRLSQDAKILKIDDIKAFIADLEFLGKVKCITRNTHAISIQEGVFTHQHLNGYKKLDISAQAGLVLNPRALDLRIFFSHWYTVFYLEQIRRNHLQKSFQVFDKTGCAVCKIYLTDESDMQVLDSLLAKYISENQSPAVFESATTPVVSNDPVSPEVAAEVDRDWRNMKEVHDFYLLMYKYNLSRQQIFRSVGDDLARKVSNSSLTDILHAAKESNEELTIFIANAGCVQIYTGLIGRIFYTVEWLNVFSHDNKLHIAQKEIDECWIVTKPGLVGEVTSLEVFDKNGEQMIQIYGQRNEGEPERESWRKIVRGVK
ncbi:ChuX/HutX family heme-like substrate-binding protein [Enterobacter sp. Bisph1]|uniref:ChuX/HutX family heme-like substrate-binding protein n=1 Tax=Enterobacter sp. Bisph1 TaxID=1274399 RepID=UPI0018CDD538|nr:ChuX/HutX family heme-like substrate-binding protein [Enterobacter sp. Bisph1]